METQAKIILPKFMSSEARSVYVSKVAKSVETSASFFPLSINVFLYKEHS